MTAHPKILEIASKITAKRPKTVIDHIIKHGSITTDDLQYEYGYEHAPRAIRDVRECGIPLVTSKVMGRKGRKIAKYTFGNPADIKAFKLDGRTTFPKKFKEELVQKYGEFCAISGSKFHPRYLQIDHRIPYEMAGDGAGGDLNPSDFMLLTGEAQRQKSWSCEHCPNMLMKKDPNTCNTCFWAVPEGYEHIATNEIRRVTIDFVGESLTVYDKLKQEADATGDSIKEVALKKLSRSY